MAVPSRRLAGGCRCPYVVRETLAPTPTVHGFDQPRAADLACSRASWSAPCRKCGQAFRTGAGPSDFAGEDYEVGWTGRATLDDLNATGREQLGLD